MQLVDTNVLSELMRQQPNAGVLLWLQGRQRVTTRIKISAITVDEIMLGLAWSPSVRLQRWFDAFLQSNEVLPITIDIARRAGELSARLKAQGQTRAQADRLIAATAQIYDLTVVTRNVNDFAGCGVGVLNPFQE
ncbi:MAG: PilT protein domain-containing protein [Comamonadaceae bacterium]|nr:MAG: PilT protein domain-containing protein [Comamonadaceae bacterium]